MASVGYCRTPAIKHNIDVTNDMSAKLYLIGKTFGRLKVIAEGPPYICPQGETHRTSECVCSCGKTVIVRNCGLRSGSNKSCGCRKTEILIKKFTKHDHAHAGHETPTYQTWKRITRRCTNQNHPDWKDYGGRGINVCERWKEYINFLSDMGEKPLGKSIDRIDNSKGYYPENCRWATPKEQARNTRRNRIVTVCGITASVAELCEIFHVSYYLAWPRLRNGWKADEAFLTPSRQKP